jgi:5-hydroxyisourate hydrolase
VPILLERQEGSTWTAIGQGETNADGRLPGLLPDGELRTGLWRITFDLAAWEQKEGVEGFYPLAQIVFRVRDATSHHHVPLLLSPFGYSTYRGS